VIIFPDDKRRLQKGLALAFVALLLVGYAFARFGESALLAEARERADEAEVELAPIAQALAGALMAEGIIAGVSASAGPQMEGRPTDTVTKVARKPWWYYCVHSGACPGNPSSSKKFFSKRR